jgi:hypothetical protein
MAGSSTELNECNILLSRSIQMCDVSLTVNSVMVDYCSDKGKIMMEALQCPSAGDTSETYFMRCVIESLRTI